MHRIQFRILQKTEEGLADGDIIGMRPKVENRNSQNFEHLERRSGYMIRGIVCHEGAIFSPVRPFAVKLGSKLMEVQFQALVVGVRMRQRQVDVPQRVKGGNHGDSRCYCMDRLNVSASALSPLHPAEIRFVEPRFIQINQDLASSKQLNNLESRLLAADHVSYGVEI